MDRLGTGRLSSYQRVLLAISAGLVRARAARDSVRRRASAHRHGRGDLAVDGGLDSFHWKLVRPLGFRDGGGHLVQWRLFDYVSRSDEPAGTKCRSRTERRSNHCEDLALVITAPASCNRLRVKGGKRGRNRCRSRRKQEDCTLLLHARLKPLPIGRVCALALVNRITLGLPLADQPYFLCLTNRTLPLSHPYPYP